jgi:hypothetical protein
MFGKSVPSSTRSPNASSRGRSARGNGACSSVKLVNAIVVSSKTLS